MGSDWKSIRIDLSQPEPDLERDVALQEFDDSGLLGSNRLLHVSAGSISGWRNHGFKEPKSGLQSSFR
jgi:hypothetical protein